MQSDAAQIIEREPSVVRIFATFLTQAVWGMGRNLCPDRLRATLAIVATLIVFALPTVWGQILAIAAGGLAGWRFLEPVSLHLPENARFRVTRGTALFAWFLFFGLLVALPLLAHSTNEPVFAVFGVFVG